jgi:2-isopropylmalate synthase
MKAAAMKTTALEYDWNGPLLTPLFRGFVDETIRDGLQMPGAPQISLETKKKLLNHVSRIGIEDVIVGFIDGTLATEKELCELVTACGAFATPLRPWVLCRLRLQDVQATERIQDHCARAVGMNVFVSMSGIRHAVEKWELEGTLHRLEECLGYGKRTFHEIRFAVEDATRTRPEVLEATLAIAADCVTRFTLADTAGVATPAGVRGIVGCCLRACPHFATGQVALEWHGHDDRGLAVANSLEALASGVAYVHGTMLGIGERNGNAALDVLLMSLSDCLGDRYDWGELCVYRKKCQEIFGNNPEDRTPFFGANSFATSTGTHCAALKKVLDQGQPDLAKRLFSPPSWMASRLAPTVLVSPLSGRKGVEAVLQSLDLPTGEVVIDHVLEFARQKRAFLTTEEIRTVATSGPL